MKTDKITIKTQFIRLDQLLKLSGLVSSGGEAKVLILEGQVSVNGQVCNMRGKKIREGDNVDIEDRGCLLVCYEAD